MPAFLTAIFIFFLLSASASARTAVSINPYGNDNYPDFQKAIDQNPLPTPGALVFVHLAPCPSLPQAGACLLDNQQIWIDPANRPDQQLKSFFHELGHLLDRQSLDDGRRAEIKSKLGFSVNTPWAEQPSEWFAELAASCWLAESKSFSSYGYPFTPQESKPACPLLFGRDAPALQPGQSTSWRVKRKGLSIGAPQLWAGGQIVIESLGTRVGLERCRSRIRFSGQRRLKYDLCQERPRLWKSFPSAVTIRYLALPNLAGKPDSSK